MLVPVITQTGAILAPCKPSRARSLIRAGKATPFYNKGFFSIRINKIVEKSTLDDCVLGIDPGSKRSGYTIFYGNKVALNIQSNSPDWIKKKVETRRHYRRSRRYRNTPYRKCRFNRSIGGIPPSTKARWQAHIRLVRCLQKILPINKVIIEDIKARTWKGSKKWNKNFSPLEVGKTWFEETIGLPLTKKQGYEVATHRKHRGFTKSSSKLAEKWDAHCVDSHSLCEMILGTTKKCNSIYIVNHIRYNRRELHQGFKKGSIRRLYGSTKSLGFNRGTIVKHPKFGIVYLGGTSKGGVSLHNLEGKRITQSARIEECRILTNNSWRVRFLP